MSFRCCDAIMKRCPRSLPRSSGGLQNPRAGMSSVPIPSQQPDRRTTLTTSTITIRCIYGLLIINQIDIHPLCWIGKRRVKVVPGSMHRS